MNLKTYTFVLAALTTTAFATTAPSTTQTGGGFNMMELLKFLPFFGLFYYFLIHQPKKNAKVQEEFVRSLKKGDKVITSAGMLAVVHKRNEKNNTVSIEISDGVIVEILEKALTKAPQAQDTVVPLNTTKNSTSKTAN